MRLEPSRAIRLASAADMQESAFLTEIDMREMSILLLNATGVGLCCLASLVWDFAG